MNNLIQHLNLTTTTDHLVLPAITILESTLREGALSEGITFSVADKLQLAQSLDRLGLHYLECGWPYATTGDLAFFMQAQEYSWQSKLTAFGATRRPETLVARDHNIQALLQASTPVVHIYGKVWALHVEKVLRTSQTENLAMLADTLSYLKNQNKEIIYTAEHFFDGWRENPRYALDHIRVALEQGADIICLGDSNGGSLPQDIRDGVRAVQDIVQHHPIGLHLHNDLGLALANALAGLEVGVSHIQGTINGYGARTGITNLSQLLPILQLKMQRTVITAEQLAQLTPVARQVAEIAGLAAELEHQPVVGRTVFMHKTPTHVAAVLSDPHAYEVIEPALVGNQRKLQLPGVRDTQHLQVLARNLGIDLSAATAANAHILGVLAELEDQGYVFEDAEASLALRLGQLTGMYPTVFQIERLRIFEVLRGRQHNVVETSLKVAIGAHQYHVATEGQAVLQSLYQVLISAVQSDVHSPYRHYLPQLRFRSVQVRTLSAHTEHWRVRVSIRFSDDNREWTTIGIDSDLMKAVWTAMLDGVEYGLVTQTVVPEGEVVLEA